MARRRSASTPLTSLARASGKRVSNAANVVAAGAAFRQGLAEAQEKGKSAPAAIAEATAKAAPQAAIASAPIVARVADGVYQGYMKQMRRSAATYAMSKNPATLARAVRSLNYARVAGVATLGVAVLTKHNAVAQAVVGAVTGAMKDENPVRGAFRGAASSFDLSALFMEKGYVERGFDRVFGAAGGDSQTRAEKSAMIRAANISAQTERKEPVARVVHTKLKGWANPKVQKAAQEARRRKMSA